ncbi:MAG: family N-acetyltransferase [Mucilaginibacter sp.]|uniref:GNAT family N-acetyltransferase n=1 Tax=Mucilaginibacter sp. TaxID=1882438 RepID=UPI00261E6E46|nr:GNAT family protein [Mucilaginibacter sp.]MDB5004880.1 family N-acetyltransferase [Mucilaginibacter sp.]
MALNFNKEAEYTLEDDSVLLRPLQLTDAPNLLAISVNEPETWEYSSKSAAGEEALKAYIEEAITARAAGTEYAFIVYDKTTQAYAGSTRFYDIQTKNEALQLGYTWYGKDFRRTGLNKHCKFLLLQFAFEALGAERVEFRADNRNDRSIAAMKSIGCTVEGVIRSHMPLHDGTRRDSIILSILKNEWHNTVKENLKSKLR